MFILIFLKALLIDSTYQKLSERKSSTSSHQVKALPERDDSFQLHSEATKKSHRKEDSSTRDPGFEDNNNKRDRSDDI